MSHRTALSNKRIVRDYSRDQKREFEDLISEGDLVGLYNWHLANTPWCAPEVIESYIDSYNE